MKKLRKIKKALIKDPSTKYCHNCKNIYKKETKNKAIFSITFLAIILIVLSSFLLFPYYLQRPAIIDYTTEKIFHEISDTFDDDEIIVSLATLCSNFENEEDKLICVNNFIKNFFDYNEELIGLKPIRYPKELINYGGVCRDYTLFYESTLSLMGFETEYVFEPKHVYLMIYGENNTYFLDQETLWEYEAYPRKEEITKTVNEPIFLEI